MTDQEYKEMIHNIEVPETLSLGEQEKRYQPLKEFLKTETPKDLYRFRSCKERTIDEFDQTKLSFSPAYKMNDDFDGLLYFDKERIKSVLIDALSCQNVSRLFEGLSQGDFHSEIKNNIPTEKLQIFLKLISRVPPNILVNQFLDYVTGDYERQMTFLCQVTRNQKIASLSTEISSPAMWGYYADNGKGFALSYDLREPNFTDFCPVPVIYGDERFDTTPYATWLFQQQLMKKILTDANAIGLYPQFQQMIPCPDNFMSTKVIIHKATTWSHEKEWRLVYYEKNNFANENFPYIIKQPTGIYLGRNISPIHEKILYHLAVKRGIPVYKMAIRESDTAYNLYPEPI